VLSGVIGGLIGLEREVRGRQAGFRTNMLVCIGSCLVMIVSLSVSMAVPSHPPGVNINSDPARIAYGVMTGIGFLGAGAILQKKDSIRGLTTAAALWCVAGLGLAAGLGLYTLAACTTLLILFTLWVLDLVEGLIPKRRYRRVTIRGAWAPGCTKSAVDWFDVHGISVVNISLSRELPSRDVDFTLIVGFMTTRSLQHLERRLQQDSPYELISIENG
jgi:putative Mg2+ transporter-C (MgtC) family protein